MKIIRGVYSEAKIFTDNIEESALGQIQELCNQPFVENSKIRIMPDVHAGSGCVIGFTADLGDLVIPNIVGVDIGCGLLTVKLGEVDIDLKKLDEVIRKYIPSGYSVHNQEIVKFDRIYDLRCSNSLKNIDRIHKSIGTLGGGNHFIEVAIDSNSDKYLVIHSGSRNLGLQVANYYQNLAVEIHNGLYIQSDIRNNIIKTCTENGSEYLIQTMLDKLQSDFHKSDIPDKLCYLKGVNRDNYLHDMSICQIYASANRWNIANIIISKLLNVDISKFEYFTTIHNYISWTDNIIRKGAISARLNEQVLIPINMRDGSILAVGKGNPDWNYSAPHGAGRIMSRNEAKKKISLEDFEYTMQNVWTTSVNESTLDESPFVYKSIIEILENIGDTVDIVDILKPIYNFKDGEKNSR